MPSAPYTLRDGLPCLARYRGQRTFARCLAGSGGLEYDKGMDDTPAQLLQRIWIDPARCAGKPCIRGHRIWVSLVLDLLASGATVAEILTDYPGLEEDDIRACLAYGS